MNKKRSKGITFWGNLMVFIGIAYGLVNSARNIWRADYIILPILYITIGIGVLCLKNWARITFIILAIVTLAMGILYFPGYLQSVSKFSEMGKGWLVAAIIILIFRFVWSLGGLIFFFQPSVKEQFKKGGA